MKKYKRDISEMKQKEKAKKFVILKSFGDLFALLWILFLFFPLNWFEWPIKTKQKPNPEGNDSIG